MPPSLSFLTFTWGFLSARRQVKHTQFPRSVGRDPVQRGGHILPPRPERDPLFFLFFCRGHTSGAVASPFPFFYML